MRTLIYVPIIHSAADMGSLGKEIGRNKLSDSIANILQKHTQTINGYWQAIETYFDHFDFKTSETKIYQDGMFLEGEMATTIINEGIRAGSKNSQIVSNPTERGATLM